MPILARDAVLSAPDLPEEIYPVPEWGGELKLKGLTLAQRGRITDMATVNGQINLARVAIFTFIAGVVEPKFSASDYEVLRDKSALIERVAMRIMKLSGIGAEALSDALKNSEPSPSADSSLN